MPTKISSRRRILVLTTGGTISMASDVTGALTPGSHIPELVKRIPELGDIAELSWQSLADMDSADLQPEFWRLLATTIYDRYDDFDGFVITHGSDTMVYTAAALSFFLQELGKPVVLTGAQIPITQIGSDGRANLVNAVRVATSDLAEVCIVFESLVIRGTRARKTSAFHLQAFRSINDEPIGRIGLTVRFGRKIRSRNDQRRPQLFTRFAPRVARTAVWPGMDPGVIRYLASTHAGIVIEGYGVGTLPSQENSLIPAIREAIAAGVAVIVGTQCIVGTTVPDLYPVGRAAASAGAIPALDMTPETAQVKLMWALGQTLDLRAVAAIMLKDYLGEIELRP